MAAGFLGSLFSGLSGSNNDEIYGTKPIVPIYDPEASYAKTIASNIALAPQAQKLAGITNKANQDQLFAMYQSVFPGYMGALGQTQDFLASERAGIVSPDVVRNIQDQGAIWGQTSGVGGGSQVDFKNLRNYGLTSMGVQRQGAADTQSYLNFLRGNFMTSPVDIRDYSINPAAALTDSWARDYEASKGDAGPDPGERGQFDSNMAILGMFLSAYGGGAGYTGQYKNPNQAGGNSGRSPGGGIGGGVGNNWWTQTEAPNYGGFNTGSSEGYGQGTGENFPFF